MDGPIKMEDGFVPGRTQGMQMNGGHQQAYDSGLGNDGMDMAYTDDTPMASNPNSNSNGTSFFNLDGMSANHQYTQNQPAFMYNQPQAQPRNLFSNGSHGNGNGNNLDQTRHSPHRVDVKPNLDALHYSMGVGEPGPSSFAHHRPGSRGTAASSSVSPIMTRHGTFRPSPMSQAIPVPVPASMPPPSPIGLRVGLTDAESDQARSVPGSGSNRKPRRSAKPRASIASTSSVGDIGANFAGMGLMNDHPNSGNHAGLQHQQQQQHQHVPSGPGAGMGQGMPFAYGIPYSAQTSTLPTPTGSNEEEDSSTKHWKVSYPPHNSLNK